MASVPRRLFSGKPMPRPHFAADLFPPETTAERKIREARAFAWAMQAVHGESIPLDQAAATLAEIRRMGSSSAPQLGGAR